MDDVDLAVFEIANATEDHVSHRNPHAVAHISPQYSHSVLRIVTYYIKPSVTETFVDVSIASSFVLYK
jgi:hypothetical protein